MTCCFVHDRDDGDVAGQVVKDTPPPTILYRPYNDHGVCSPLRIEDIDSPVALLPEGVVEE